DLNRSKVRILLLGCVMVLGVSVTCGQQKKPAPVDPNKYAVIINGPGGEATYTKQFEEWTGQLKSVLSDRYGFDAKHITVPRATAEEVKGTFATLKTQLDANNVLFVFLIGHGSFDGKESKFNLIGPDLSASE